MKKSLLFIAALCGMVAVNANTITLEPGEDKIADAIASAEAGDVIELTGDAENEYTEWNTITLDKAITLKAAEGATPVVHMPKIKTNAEFTAEGIEFYGFTDYLFRTEVGGDFSLTFRNCEIHDNPAYVIYISSGQSINALTIDGCIFHDNTKNENAVVNGSGTIGTFTFTNNTVYNIPGQFALRVQHYTNAIIDHCTFYNCGERPILMAENDHTAAAVSNTVVANLAEVTGYCIATYAGTVDNCVYYNTASGAHSGPTITNLTKADPIFVNPAEGNFNFAFTSPLFLAATDGSNIGDPRWGVEAEDAIAVPGTLTKDDATLIGPKIEKNDNGIQWKDQDDPTLNSASWTIDVTKAGNYNVIVNVSDNSTTTHNFNVSLYDKNGLVKTLDEPNATSGTGAMNCGAFTIATAGKYLVRLMNATQWSSATAENISMTYAGGAVVDVPSALPIDDALLYGPKIKKTEDGIAWNDNGDATADYAVWNVNVDKAGDYIVKMTVSKTVSSGHSFSIDIYDSNNQKVGNTINEPSGEVTLAAGNYTVRLNNGTAWSSAVIESVSIFYKGGAEMPIPGMLPGEEAVLTSQMIRLTNGSFQWPNKSDQENHYATWNVIATDAGNVDVTLHVGTPSSGHCFTVGLYEGEVLKASISEDATVHSTGILLLGSITIPAAGSYTIRLNNTVQWSSAIVDSIKLSPAVAPTVITIGDNDNEVDFTAYEGQIVNIKLNRTIKADMFTPFCLPFALHSDALNSVLKSDKAYVLDDAQIQDQTLSVKLQTYSSIYQGTPFLIKPTEEVVDPIFENVTIMDDPQASSTTRGDVTFQGSFAKENLTESDKVLLVGNNNTLFYPNDATPYIKSMRAYFRVNVEANKLPRFAAFVEPGNAPTEMIIVGGEAERQKGHRKVLVDGQIRIQHEGKCYSILGLER